MIRVTIYWIGFAIVLVLLGLYSIFKKEYEEIEESSRYEQVIGILYGSFQVLFIIFLVAFCGYNIYLLAIRYDTLLWLLSFSFIVFIASLGIIFLLRNQEWKYFDFIRYPFSVISILIAVVSGLAYILLMFVFLLDGSACSMDNDETYSQYAYSIDILEMKEVPYTNISGSMWYIRSAPSNAYYYEVATKSGNTTTKVLDGYAHYVEKDEDDKYINNPHIEVIYTMQECYNMYTMKTTEAVIGESYIICIPENAIYYEEE